MESRIPISNTNPTSAQKVVEIKNLGKKFGDRVILNDVSLVVHDRENVVLLGRSGTGKSVLIKCMVGLLVRDSGDINVLGYDVPNLTDAELNELRLQVGFSFQGSALYDSMTIRENLEFPLKRNLGIYDRTQLNDMVMTSLKEVGLEHTANQNPLSYRVE